MYSHIYTLSPIFRGTKVIGKLTDKRLWSIPSFFHDKLSRLEVLEWIPSVEAAFGGWSVKLSI